MGWVVREKTAVENVIDFCVERLTRPRAGIAEPMGRCIVPRIRNSLKYG